MLELCCWCRLEEQEQESRQRQAEEERRRQDLAAEDLVRTDEERLKQQQLESVSASLL